MQQTLSKILKTPESAIQQSIISALRQKFKCFVWKTSDRFTSGIPDLLIISKGRHIFLEIKTDTGKTSKLQDYHISEIKKHGGEAYVVRSVEETIKIMEGGEHHERTNSAGRSHKQKARTR